MAMNGDQLANEVKVKYEALAGLPAGANFDVTFIKALTNAIVDHIKNNAEVSTTVSLVTPGFGTASGTGGIS